MPYIAFVSSDRLPDDRSKASPVPPDLAVEVISQTDTILSVEEKVIAYLEAGTQLVRVIKPRSKTVNVYRSETDIILLTQMTRPAEKMLLKDSHFKLLNFMNDVKLDTKGI